MTNTPPPLPITDCVAEAWRAFWRNPWLGLGIILLHLALNGLQWTLSEVSKDNIFLGGVIPFLLAPLVYGGTAAVARRMIEGPRADFSGMRLGMARWPQIMGAILLIVCGAALITSPLIAITVLLTLGLAPREVLVPLLVLVMVPILPVAIWVGVRLSLIHFTLTDEAPVGPLAAFRRTWSMSRGRFWRLFGLQLLLMLVQVLGAMALLVGLLVTLPMILLGEAAAYVRLRPAPAVALPLVQESIPQPVLET